MTFAKVADHAQHCVAAVVAGTEIGIGTPIGSGFFLNEEGYLATSARVIREAERWRNQGVAVALYVPAFVPETSRICGMDAAEVRVVAIDDDDDVAVLHAPNLRKAPSFFSLCVTEVPPGTELAFTGYPLSQDLPVTVACHAATPATQESLAKVLTRGSKILGPFFLLDVPIPRGATGSAIYLKQAAVAVGIATGALPADGGSSTFGYVRPLNRLVEILREQRIAHARTAPLDNSAGE